VADPSSSNGCDSAAFSLAEAAVVPTAVAWIKMRLLTRPA
jgi:hypothetical protein